MNPRMFLILLALGAAGLVAVLILGGWWGDDVPNHPEQPAEVTR